MDLWLIVLWVALWRFSVGDTADTHWPNHTTDFLTSLELSFSSLVNEVDKSYSNATGPQLGWEDSRPEPLDDDNWKRFVCKGTKMLAQMSYSDFDVAQMLPTKQITVQSMWQFRHLKEWGYQMGNVHEAYRNFEDGGYWGIATLFRLAKISDKCVEEGGTWRAAVIDHANPYAADETLPQQTYLAPDGSTRRKTGAHFYMAVTPDGGIMTQNRLGPRESAKKAYPDGFPDSELPLLQKSSDMMWCMWWTYVVPEKRKNLKFFVSLSIGNPTTLAILGRAMPKDQQPFTTVSTKFDMNTEQGKAILASPNGAGFAHFLIQRKELVGLKTIESVYVFECRSKSHAPCMLFAVKDLDKPVPRPEETTPGPKLPQDPNENPNDGPKGDIVVGEQQHKRSILRVHTIDMNENPGTRKSIDAEIIDMHGGEMVSRARSII